MDEFLPRKIRTSKRINIKSHFDRVYWSRELNITQKTLCLVVALAGPMVEAVEVELKQNKVRWDGQWGPAKEGAVQSPTRVERRSPVSVGALLRR